MTIASKMVERGRVYIVKSVERKVAFVQLGKRNRWLGASCTQPNEINDPGLGKDTLVRETLRASTEVNEELPGKSFLRDLYGSSYVYIISL